MGWAFSTLPQGQDGPWETTLCTDHGQRSLGYGPTLDLSVKDALLALRQITLPNVQTPIGYSHETLDYDSRVRLSHWLAICARYDQGRTLYLAGLLTEDRLTVPLTDFVWATWLVSPSLLSPVADAFSLDTTELDLWDAACKRLTTFPTETRRLSGGHATTSRAIGFRLVLLTSPITDNKSGTMRFVRLKDRAMPGAPVPVQLAPCYRTATIPAGLRTLLIVGGYQTPLGHWLLS